MIPYDTMMVVAEMMMHTDSVQCRKLLLLESYYNKRITMKAGENTFAL